MGVNALTLIEARRFSPVPGYCQVHTAGCVGILSTAGYVGIIPSIAGYVGIILSTAGSVGIILSTASYVGILSTASYVGILQCIVVYH